jgi:hypothetical protein
LSLFCAQPNMVLTFSPARHLSSQTCLSIQVSWHCDVYLILHSSRQVQREIMSWKECQRLVGGTINCIIQPFCGLAPMWSAHQYSRRQLSGVWQYLLRRTAVATFFPKSMAFKWNIFLEWLKNCLVQGFLILRICIFFLSATWHLSSICLYCLGQCACFSFHWVLVFWPEGCLFKNYGWRSTVNHKW